MAIGRSEHRDHRFRARRSPIPAKAIAHREPGCAEWAPQTLTGADSLWRIRIGDYRVLYEIQDEREVVDILAIRHRSDAYR
jgi:ParE-like toxin of type II ParDE toxin-antitoxin system